MGNLTSSVDSRVRHGAPAPHRKPVLREQDAWDIALTWRDELRGCVRLETASERLSSSIIPTFAWVTFAFNGSLLVEEGLADVKDPLKTAAYARAATIAWFALSCCDGYAGTENPQFWRRVFVEFLYPKGLPELSKRAPRPSRGQLPITEAVRFFDDPEKPFPRIKLVVGAADETVATERVFLGQEPRRGKVRDAQLQQILTKLQPFIRAAQWTHGVPVQVSDLTSVVKAARLLWDAAETMTTREVQSESNQSTDAPMHLPQMQLQSLALKGLTSSTIEMLYELLPSPCDAELELNVGLWNIVHDHRVCRGLLPPLLAKAFGATRPRWRVVRLFIMQAMELSYSHLSVLCSALPHQQNITTMTLPALPYLQGIPTSPTSDWAWLGYAIFHPDAASQSGFSSLEVDLSHSTPADLNAFRAMATGNNLLGGFANSTYLEGLVRSSSDVWTRPGEDDARKLETIATELWVNLCGDAAHGLMSQEWICAVIPGYGLGWIRGSDILEVRCRPPGASCIRTLCVHATRGEISEDVLTQLLAAVGDGVTTLSFKCNQRLLAPTVERILGFCPSLRSLSVCHDGSFWSDEQLSMALPRLEELSLTVKGSAGSTIPFQELKPACLPHLKALQVVSSYEDSFTDHGEAVLTSFLKSQHALQYIHWSDGSDLYPTWADKSQYRKSEATGKFLHQLPAENHLSHGVFRVACRLAFLSVVRREAGRSSVGKLGEDVAALIFQYATSTTPREIYINL